MIKKFDPLSTTDDPRGIAFVFYTDSCNMRCSYCHNRDLILCPEEEGFPFDYIATLARQQKKYINYAVITGGEPLMSHIPQLLNHIEEIRTMGYSIKLDTNGIHTDNLKTILHTGYIDYVAMDVKTKFDRYFDLTSTNLVHKNVDELEATLLDSIRTLYDAQRVGEIDDFEIRTTCIDPYINRHIISGICDDLLPIVKEHGKIPHWYLQTGRLTHGVLNPKINMRTLTPDEMMDCLDVVRDKEVTAAAMIR